MVYSERLKGYDFGWGHPFRADRYVNFMKLFREKVGDSEIFEVVEPREATEQELLLVHSQEYIDFIQTASRRLWAPSYRFLSPDTPLQPGMGEAARLVVGASLLAGELVWEGKFNCAVGVGGGLHHARSSYGAGFCIYNDVAICIKNLLGKYNLERILVLDTDAHAGDGTAEIFYQDPRILFIDLHQDPRTLYPGRGFAHEMGTGEGEGFTVNVPLPPGASCKAYSYALKEIFTPLALEFRPQLIIRNGGSDPHFTDELTNLGLTVEGLRDITRLVKQVADEVCGGKVVDLIGSGYNAKVLPYGWLALVLGLSGLELELGEPFFFSLNEDAGLEETRRTVKGLKKRLSEFWKCF